ncbi:MAG: D-glycero-beta-D-manno-heptose 1-phosphate adenylyltransferase [Desulfobacterales bacterium]|nr:D-glycero-beta-D-manno-heptose 1-phosphate adenylyltransferase [Desulfobacterales bacterium]
MISKIVKVEELINKIALLRKSGKQVVFTNGCFDIMHAGHVRYLTEARSKGEILVVGLNSDKSIKLIKEKNRPIIPQDQRAEVLAGLWCVDYVVFFDEPDPLRLIQAIKPDTIVKGKDWDEDKIIGAGFVKADGGKVVRIAVVPDISTSAIIEKIIKMYC